MTMLVWSSGTALLREIIFLWHHLLLDVHHDRQLETVRRELLQMKMAQQEQVCRAAAMFFGTLVRSVFTAWSRVREIIAEREIVEHSENLQHRLQRQNAVR